MRTGVQEMTTNVVVGVAMKEVMVVEAFLDEVVAVEEEIMAVVWIRCDVVEEMTTVRV